MTALTPITAADAVTRPPLPPIDPFDAAKILGNLFGVQLDAAIAQRLVAMAALLPDSLDPDPPAPTEAEMPACPVCHEPCQGGFTFTRAGRVCADEQACYNAYVALDKKRNRR